MSGNQLADDLALLKHYAPAAFAGLEKMQAGGALVPKTRELIFTLLSVQGGDAKAAACHAVNARNLGLTMAELAEGLTQVIMVGGIGTWTTAGLEAMRAFEGIVAMRPEEPRGTEGGHG